MATATLQDIHECRNIAVDICVRVAKRIADTRLRCQMKDGVELCVAEQSRDRFPIGEVELQE
jgi:hypothetical protein